MAVRFGQRASQLNCQQYRFSYQSGDGLYLDDPASDTDSTWTYSNWYDNVGQDASGESSLDVSMDGNLSQDPLFDSYSMDGDCNNDLLTLSTVSPLIDRETLRYWMTMALHRIWVPVQLLFWLLWTKTAMGLARNQIVMIPTLTLVHMQKKSVTVWTTTVQG